MSNFDQWLTTDTAADAAEQYAVHILDAWEEYAEANHLPYQAAEDAHPEHAIYTAWETLFHATEAFHERLLAEEEAAAYVEECQDQAYLNAVEIEEHLA